MLILTSSGYCAALHSFFRHFFTQISSSSSAPLLLRVRSEIYSNTSHHSCDIFSKTKETQQNIFYFPGRRRLENHAHKKRSRISSISLEETEEDKETRPNLDVPISTDNLLRQYVCHTLDKHYNLVRIQKATRIPAFTG